MRYELTDHEWFTIKPMLPNKSRDVPRVNDRRVRVHQHGACISRNRTQSIGRSWGGLTSKIHALVDKNGLPPPLALTPAEAHDNRLARKFLSRLKPGSMLLVVRRPAEVVKYVTTVFPNPCHVCRCRKTWISLMANSGSLATRCAYPAEHATSRPTPRKTIFTRMIEVLHFSRRLEATRVLRRYHHLIAEASQGQPKQRPTGLR
jgi:transposase